MAARTKSKVTPKYKTKYRVTNWPAYEAALRKRGDLTLWFDEDVVSGWDAAPSGRPGGQRRYSDLAIVTALTLRLVFHLRLRQAEGLLTSLIRLMGLDLRAPDHTTLSRRNSSVEVPPLAKTHDGPIHLVIDSTGLKMVGDGEWHAHRLKTSNKRRAWRKLHLGVDDDGFIVASKLTDSSVDDASVGVEMIDGRQAGLGRFTGDGAYLARAVYGAVAASGAPDVRIVVPPKKTSTTDPRATGPWVQRNEALERSSEALRRQWRQKVGAHQQARAENAMTTYKRIIGDGLRARKLEGQKRKTKIAVRVLNRMAEFGMPCSEAMVA